MEGNEISRIEVRREIEKRTKKVEEVMKTMPQVEMETNHYFLPGLYLRELIIPAGTLLVGRKHKTYHISIMIEGEMDVVGENGIKRIKGRYIHEGKKGTKRVGYTVKESRWITIHFNGSGDLKKIEEEEFEKEEEMFDFESGKVLNPEIQADREDYWEILKELGYDERKVREETEIEIDRVDIELFPMGLEIEKSEIQGMGIKSKKWRKKGEIVGPARMGVMRTQLGRYVNHSVNPNCRPVLLGGVIYLETVREMESGEEITVNYRDMIKYRNVIEKGNENKRINETPTIHEEVEI